MRPNVTIYYNAAGRVVESTRYWPTICVDCKQAHVQAVLQAVAIEHLEPSNPRSTRWDGIIALKEFGLRMRSIYAEQERDVHIRADRESDFAVQWTRAQPG